VATCTVTAVTDGGIEVKVAGDIGGFIRRAELSRDRSEQRPERFAPGDRVDAKIINVDRKDRKVSLSIKAHEIEEEKQAMAEYGSSDSGASLGEILGPALRRTEEGGKKKDEE
jgi:small subunit ribosomal protein S1